MRWRMDGTYLWPLAFIWRRDSEWDELYLHFPLHDLTAWTASPLLSFTLLHTEKPQKQQFQMSPRKYQPCPSHHVALNVTPVITFNILSIQMIQNPHNRMCSIIPPSPGEELTMKDICFCDMFQNFQMRFQAHTVCVTIFSFTSVINWYFSYTKWVSRNETPFWITVFMRN